MISTRRYENRSAAPPGRAVTSTPRSATLGATVDAPPRIASLAACLLELVAGAAWLAACGSRSTSRRRSPGSRRDPAQRGVQRHLAVTAPLPRSGRLPDELCGQGEDDPIVCLHDEPTSGVFVPPVHPAARPHHRVVVCAIADFRALWPAAPVVELPGTTSAKRTHRRQSSHSSSSSSNERALRGEPGIDQGVSIPR